MAAENPVATAALWASSLGTSLPSSRMSPSHTAVVAESPSTTVPYHTAATSARALVFSKGSPTFAIAWMEIKLWLWSGPC